MISTYAHASQYEMEDRAAEYGAQSEYLNCLDRGTLEFAVRRRLFVVVIDSQLTSFTRLAFAYQLYVCNGARQMLKMDSGLPSEREEQGNPNTITFWQFSFVVPGEVDR